jgi:hypothetical protein
LILRFAESFALAFARVLCTNGSGRGCIYS